MPTATCPIPAHESSHVRRAWRARSDDAFHEAVVQMEALRQTRGGDRNGRAQNDGKHSPLQAVELDPHGQGFQPLSRDRFETRIEGRLFHAGLFPPLPEALSSALASAVSRPVACAAVVRVPHWTAPYRADATTQKYRDFPAVDGAGGQVAGIDYTHAD